MTIKNLTKEQVEYRVKRAVKVDQKYIPKLERMLKGSNQGLVIKTLVILHVDRVYENERFAKRDVGEYLNRVIEPHLPRFIKEAIELAKKDILHAEKSILNYKSGD